MADKKLKYRSLLHAVERKSKELKESLTKGEKLVRAVRSKTDKLQKDLISLEAATQIYVESLSTEEGEDLITKHLEQLDNVNQVLEKAQEVLEDEDTQQEELESLVIADKLDKSIASQITRLEKKVEQDEEVSIGPEETEILKREIEKLSQNIDKLEFLYGVLIKSSNTKEKGELGLKKTELCRESCLELELALSRFSVKSTKLQDQMKDEVSLDQQQISDQRIESNVNPRTESGINSSNYQPNIGRTDTTARVQIQKIKPPVFDGEIVSYPAWKKRWRELITPGSSSDCEELYRMQDAMGVRNLGQTLRTFQTLTEAWTI